MVKFNLKRKNMKYDVIILAVLLIGGALWAKGKVIKTDNGYKIKKSHTYYQGKVSWGEGFNDHTANSPITGIAVLSVGDGWTYSTVTDANGVFKVEVKPAKAFKLRMSDGNEWVDFGTQIKGIPEGTTAGTVK